jgi:hypothetical protein
MKDREKQKGEKMKTKTTQRASDNFFWVFEDGMWRKKCKRCEKQTSSDASNFMIQNVTHKDCWTTK